MPLQVTALYAALIGLVGYFLQIQVGRMRGRTHISLLHGGKSELIEADRRHMNWVENAPFLLLLLAIIELNGGSKIWLHGLGAALLVGRIIHPFGIFVDKMPSPARFVGATLTLLVALAAIGTLLWQALGR
jgi:uncharacterized membrane protein YecN with MAPEG domain